MPCSFAAVSPKVSVKRDIGLRAGARERRVPSLRANPQRGEETTSSSGKSILRTTMQRHRSDTEDKPATSASLLSGYSLSHMTTPEERSAAKSSGVKTSSCPYSYFYFNNSTSSNKISKHDPECQQYYLDEKEHEHRRGETGGQTIAKIACVLAVVMFLGLGMPSLVDAFRRSAWRTQRNSAGPNSILRAVWDIEEEGFVQMRPWEGKYEIPPHIPNANIEDDAARDSMHLQERIKDYATRHPVFPGMCKDAYGRLVNDATKHVIKSSVRNLYKHPQPNEIAVVSLFGGELHNELYSRTFRNHKDYANRHGYRHVAVRHGEIGTSPEVFSNLQFRLKEGWDERGFAWAKIPLIQAVLASPEIRLVFWMDADAIFTNMAVSLDVFAAQDKDLIIGGDWNGINSGSFFVRDSTWSKDLLNTVWDVFPAPIPEWSEQSALIVVLFGGPHIKSLYTEEKRALLAKSQMYSHMALSHVDRHQKLIHKEYRDRTLFVPHCVMSAQPWTFVPGTFIVHPAGQGIEEKLQTVRTIFEQHITSDTSTHCRPVPALSYRVGAEKTLCVPKHMPWQ